MHSAPALSKVARPRWPRQFAQLILAAGDDAARAVLWAKVPADWRELVQLHIAQADGRTEQHVRQQEKLRPAVRTITPTFGEYRAPVHVPGNAVVAAQHLAALRATIHSPRVSQ
nr:MAG TPA: hypothetical protein [Caudoviricetes sp.]